MQEPIKQDKHTVTEECNSCKVVAFENEKERNHCEFCGVSNCAKCFTQRREFPKSKLDSKGEKLLGNICILCHKKFLIRAVLISTNAALAKKRSLITKQIELKQDIAVKLRETSKELRESKESFSELATKLQSEVDLLKKTNDRKQKQSFELEKKVKFLRVRQNDLETLLHKELNPQDNSELYMAGGDDSYNFNRSRLLNFSPADVESGCKFLSSFHH